jgi:hypothetical protein
MDVKTTFLHGDLEEEIYMKQPEGFVVKGKKELVCKLKKSLYGLKQSPRMWYQKFDTYILGLRFVRSRDDHCVYSKQVGNHFIYVVLYVDDMLLVGNNMDVIKEVKSQLSSKFDMNDLGAANFILGMEIKRDRANNKLWLNQRKYVEMILQRFNMHGSKSVKVPIPIGVKLSADQCPKTQEEEEDVSHVPYASAIGSLMYAMVCTRPGHCTCSGSFEQVYVKTREGALDSSKEGLQVSSWHHQLWIVLPRKTGIGQCGGHTWLC